MATVGSAPVHVSSVKCSSVVNTILFTSSTAVGAAAPLPVETDADIVVAYTTVESISAAASPYDVLMAKSLRSCYDLGTVSRSSTTGPLSVTSVMHSSI